MSVRDDQPDGRAGLAPTAELRRNLELKARLESLETARQVARRLATEQQQRQVQTDVYFHCRHGRLKIRHIEGGPAQLLWYARPDQQEVALSQYRLAEVPDAAAVELALAGALGIWLSVRKCREIYMYHNVRIHLDQVEGLGEFLEFEAVLGPTADEPTSQQRLDFLSSQFGIRPESLVEKSYSDLLAGDFQGENGTS
jgi:predicted adenylyl cyclase CyaB